MIEAAPPAPPLGGGRHRSVRSFKAFGVFVLVIGAIAGGFLGLARHPGDNPVAAKLPAAVGPTTTLTPDPARAKALADAQARAAAAAMSAAASAKKANDAAVRASQAASRGQTRTDNLPVPASCNEFTGNRQIGCALLLEAGFGLDQFSCLDKLFTKESHWTVTAENKSSGAYGIPQALPGSKMGAYGADWQTNPVTQIKWALNYIKRKYGTPCDAWAHSVAYNNY